MDDQTAIHPGHRPKKESARRKQKEAELDAEFEAFWAAYPRHKDKAAARKAYGKAKAATSAEEILAGAHRYAEERAGEEEKYTKHAATWLNHRCCEDPVTPKPRPKPTGKTAGEMIYGHDIYRGRQ